MKRNLITLFGVVIIIAGIVGVRTVFEQTIQTEAELAAAAETEKQLEEAAKITEENKAKETLVAAATEAAGTPPPPSPPQPVDVEGFETIEWPEAAPETYTVKFDTTKGPFIIECNATWSEEGSKRFFDLCKMGFFNNSGFFRVVPGFVVQFGLAADPRMTAQFANKNLRDETVRKSNQKGKISYAAAGPNTRTTQVFINFGDNANLDQMGFAPFGDVIVGMENVEKINSEYGEQPDQGLLKQEGTEYLKRDFPNLDYITTVSLVQKKA